MLWDPRGDSLLKWNSKAKQSISSSSRSRSRSSTCAWHEAHQCSTCAWSRNQRVQPQPEPETEAQEEEETRREQAAEGPTKMTRSIREAKEPGMQQSTKKNEEEVTERGKTTAEDTVSKAEENNQNAPRASTAQASTAETQVTTNTIGTRNRSDERQGRRGLTEQERNRNQPNRPLGPQSHRLEQRQLQNPPLHGTGKPRHGRMLATFHQAT